MLDGDNDGDNSTRRTSTRTRLSSETSIFSPSTGSTTKNKARLNKKPVTKQNLSKDKKTTCLPARRRAKRSAIAVMMLISIPS